MADALVSICIPSYKKHGFILGCLRSKHQQDYKNIEVIVSNDLPDETIKKITVGFRILRMGYFHNPVPLETILQKWQS